MSATQTIVFQGSSQLSDTSGLVSYRIPKPPCQIGDLLILQIGTSEVLLAASALVADTADIVPWTDVLTDGYTEPGARYQYILDDGVNLRQFWWVGTKIATLADTRPGYWTVNVHGSAFGGINPGSDRCKADCVAYRGGATVSAFAAQTFKNFGATVTTLTCPDAGYGDRTWSSPLGNFDVQAGISMVVQPAAGSLPLLVCGGMVWSAQAIPAPDPPLEIREGSIMTAIVKDAGVWGENAPLTVHVWDPHHIGHDR